jgi:hypothetical protein
MRKTISFTVVLFACAAVALAGEQIPAIETDQFQNLHVLIKPQPGESPWRKIAWLTSVTEARRKAAAEGKPMVIFTAADGSPLSRT